MRCRRNALAGAVVLCSFAAQAQAVEFGRPATPQEIKLWNIDVKPDGEGLPDGSGTARHGRDVYAQNCEACHGPNGEGGIKDRLVGGQGTLASAKPIKTVGSYWEFAPTVFDYVRRAMPYPSPQSLSADDTYAVVAYILSLNKILPTDATLDKNSLPKIRMPNRDGFVPDNVFKLYNERSIAAKCVCGEASARREARRHRR